MRRTRRAGVAGIEFALVSPILLTLLLGTIDISEALLTARRMEIAAGSVVEIGITAASQTLAPDQLTDVQAWQATTAPFALFPAWTAKVNQGSFAITLSGVAFSATPTGCRQACSYTARVRWSVGNELGIVRLRACGQLAAAANGDGTSYLTLPVGNFGTTSLLIADISYTFEPMFFGFLVGAIPMIQSAYLSPRIGSGISLVRAGGQGVVAFCPVAS